MVDTPPGLKRHDDKTLIGEEVSRLESLGVRRLEAPSRDEHGSHGIVTADREGNEFCAYNAGDARYFRSRFVGAATPVTSAPPT